MKKTGNSFFIREEMLTIFGWNFEIWAVQKYLNLVDLVKSFPFPLFLNMFFQQDPYSNEYLLANIGVDTAENEPLEVHLIIKAWDLFFTEILRKFWRKFAEFLRAERCEGITIC